MHALAGKDEVSGGEGDDTLYGGSYADKMLGGNGRDEIYGGRGNDFISSMGTTAAATSSTAAPAP